MKYLIFMLLYLSITTKIKADEIKRPFQNVRSLSLGGTGVASEKHFYALFFNPANILTREDNSFRLYLINPQISISQDGLNLVGEYSEISNAELSFGKIIKEWDEKDIYIGANLYLGFSWKNFALALVSDGYGNFEFDIDEQDILSTEWDKAIEADAAQRFGILAGYAQDLPYGFTLGLKLKFLQKTEIREDSEKIATELNDMDYDTLLNLYNLNLSEYMITGEGLGIGVDIGATWEHSSWINTRLSIVAYNINETNYDLDKIFDIIDNENKPRSEKQIFASGVSFEKSYVWGNTTANLDIYDLTNRTKENIFKRLHLGLMLNFLKYFSLRGGYYQGWPTYGFHIAYKIISLEYAKYTVERSDDAGDTPDHRHSVQLNVGWNL